MAKKLTSNKAKKILHDKSVHGHPLTDKQRKFFGAIAGGAPIKAQKGQSKKNNNNYIVDEIGKNEHDLMSTYVNPFLNQQIDLAYSRNINTGNHNGPLDAIRHAGSAAGISSSVLPDWTSYIPGVAPLKIIGTNILGAAHELMSPGEMNWKETGSDLYNNFIGSVVGALPISNYKKQQMIIDAEKNGILSDLGNKIKIKKHKTGGWLEKYAEGGMQEHQENYNENTTSYPPGFVGMGYNTKGRNYSPAWGGQFANGGDLPGDRLANRMVSAPAHGSFSDLQGMVKQPGMYNAMQPFYDELFKSAAKYSDDSGKISGFNRARASVKALLKHPEVMFMKRHDLPEDVQSQNPYHEPFYHYDQGNIHITGKPSQYAIPRKSPSDKSENNHEGLKDWWQEHISQPIHNWNDQRKINRDIKKQGKCWGANCYDDETPTAAMGGSIPGSVGFTYARTNSPAPSNGPYAKKTKASAQNGTKLTKAEEKTYQVWRSKLPKGLQWEGDYDLKGLWKANPKVKPSPNLHFPDTYKLPNHPTFSNESNYYDSYTPGVGGYWGEGEENFIKNPQIGPPVPHAENGMTYYQHGLDWKPKSMKEGGWLDKYEPIKDDRGQWAHPGKITEIGSNQITMQGVDYPVLGISDKGDTKMMLPGEEYKFKGKKVTEFPMAQKGLDCPINVSAPSGGGGGLGHLFEGIGDALSSIGSGIGGFASSVGDMVGSVGGGIEEFFEDIFSGGNEEENPCPPGYYYDSETGECMSGGGGDYYTDIDYGSFLPPDHNCPPGANCVKPEDKKKETEAPKSSPLHYNEVPLNAQGLPIGYNNRFVNYEDIQRPDLIYNGPGVNLPDEGERSVKNVKNNDLYHYIGKKKKGGWLDKYK